MADRSKHPCGRPGCPELTLERYCTKHAQYGDRSEARERGTTTERGYGHDWQKLSTRYRQAHPLCEQHEARGEVVAATLVDHIIPIEVAPQRRLDEENLQSLCDDCHATKTEADRLKYPLHYSARGKRPG